VPPPDTVKHERTGKNWAHKRRIHRYY
jgi:hypothetical protein